MSDELSIDPGAIPEQFDGRRRWDHSYMHCFSEDELIHDIGSLESEGFEIVTINIDYFDKDPGSDRPLPTKYWEVWMKRPYRYKQTPEGFIKTYE